MHVEFTFRLKLQAPANSIESANIVLYNHSALPQVNAAFIVALPTPDEVATGVAARIAVSCACPSASATRPQAGMAEWLYIERGSCVLACHTSRAL